MKGMTFKAARVPEASQLLRSLELGATFRFPGISFEDATTGDDTGGNFSRVLKLVNDDGAVEVISWDFKVRRKLPAETLVVEHSVDVGFIRNDPVDTSR